MAKMSDNRIPSLDSGFGRPLPCDASSGVPCFVAPAGVILLAFSLAFMLRQLTGDAAWYFLVLIAALGCAGYALGQRPRGRVREPEGVRAGLTWAGEGRRRPPSASRGLTGCSGTPASRTG